MKIKTIVVLLMIMLTSVLFAGCIGDDESDIEEIPIAINETPAEVIEETPVEEPVEELPVIDPQTYTLRMENRMVKMPSPLEINRGDTVDWKNLQDPKRMLVLVSDDNLWDNYSISPMQKFTYTFNKSGTYNFSVTNIPKMSGSIVVK